MELQRNLKTMQANGIRPYAISPDPVSILANFAEKNGIEYPLLSDEDSAVIRAFGILNTLIPEDHDWYGVPFPGTYLVGEDGKVLDKSFIAGHGPRETVNNFLQESFRITDMERGEMLTVKTDHLTAKAYFASPSLRRAQRMVLTVEVSLAESMHVYGRPLPEGYIPVELIVESDYINEVTIEYPPPTPYRFDALDETLPAYAGDFVIKARCHGGGGDSEGQFVVKATLRYQACDDRECYLPQTIALDLPLEFLATDWESYG